MDLGAAAARGLSLLHHSELTNSPFMVGVAMGMRMLPLFFAGVPAGALADRFPRHRLLMLTVSNRPHTWWPGIASPALMAEVRSAATAKQVTDGYLLGLARRNGGRIVTFDRALAATGGTDAACVLPS